MIGDNLEKYSYEYLMATALSYVDDSFDKREGSIIFDAIAPCCQLLAGFAIELKSFYSRTCAVTATGEDLDNRVAEQGISRFSATRAIKKLELFDGDGAPLSVPLGSRFSTLSDTNPINYKITEIYKEDDAVVPGAYKAECEEAGAKGNEYSGEMVNITFIQGLARAVLSTTLVPARDTETDEDLRSRYFNHLTSKAFGGNIADYRSKVEAIEGVGALQIYPTWNGGGSVKLSVVDPQYNKCSSEFIQYLQNAIDPENVSGSAGVGLGIAPIGHQVTVTTPTEVTVVVNTTIVLTPGFSIGQVKEPIRDAISNYFDKLKKEWAVADSNNDYHCSVVAARITAAVISVPGVSNVTRVTLNGASADIELTQTGKTQQLPKLGVVTVEA